MPPQLLVSCTPTALLQSAWQSITASFTACANIKLLRWRSSKAIERMQLVCPPQGRSSNQKRYWI
jgi:hypothetical protein